MTVLSPYSTQQVGFNTLQLQLASYNELKLAAEQQTIADGYQQKVNSVNLDANKFRALSDDLDDVVAFLTSTANRAEQISKKLDELRSIVWKAQYWGNSGDGVSHKAYSLAFDAIIRTINSTANTAIETPNLLGSTEHSAYTYYSTVAGQLETVSRSDLSTDYEIVDAGGNTWKRVGEFSKLLTQYDSTTAATGLYAHLSTGLQLDSLSGSNVGFTISPDTTDTQSFTGTITFSGLKVGDSWYYDGLASSTGRDQAKEDLDYAIAWAEGNAARLKGELATATFYRDKADTAISGYRNLIDDYTISQALELQEAESTYSALNDISVLSVANNQAVRDQYTKLLSASSISPVFQSLIDLTA
ncbi:MAG: hypothetical protein HOK06_07830 [Rhodospirillaceae bacterium]|nr:hypothetical protein [Rhodospirillaceae bacterium]MBT4220045.1 hypothetical protein [Rhodospirillaceae bacterium]MBT5013796.1 hypothetical protein [Rhodospirillaceae bacterium]MBT5308983.1 hypothetical protein [Rhodospirillaceae bacterium]MBT6407498.1 hypothetical protein [Rhodospirillaceae bacterium]